MVKEKRLAIFSYLFSAVLLIIGSFPQYFAIPEHLSFAFLSAGLSAVIHSLYQTKRILSFKKNPKQYGLEQIESKDERNHLILQISKAKTFETSSYLLIVLMLVFVVLDEFLIVLILFSFGFMSLSMFIKDTLTSLGGYFMYTYAFVGYLDHETEVNFRGLWKDLSEQNISHYGVDTKGKRPHITIADYDVLDLNFRT